MQGWFFFLFLCGGFGVLWIREFARNFEHHQALCCTRTHLQEVAPTLSAPCFVLPYGVTLTNSSEKTTVTVFRCSLFQDGRSLYRRPRQDVRPHDAM